MNDRNKSCVTTLSTDIGGPHHYDTLAQSIMNLNRRQKFNTGHLTGIDHPPTITLYFTVAMVSVEGDYHSHMVKIHDGSCYSNSMCLTGRDILNTCC